MASMTEIGKLIGIIDHSFKVKIGSIEVQTSNKFDCRYSTVEEFRSWIAANRTIVRQKPLKALSVEEAKAQSGSVVIAGDCGLKIEARSDKIDKFVKMFISSGLSEDKAAELASKAVDDPSSLL